MAEDVLKVTEKATQKEDYVYFVSLPEPQAKQIFS